MSEHSISNGSAESAVITNCTLNKEGFNHYFVNQSLQFVSFEDRTVHMQNIERLWKSVKSSIKGEGRPAERDEFYIFQFFYNHKLKLSRKGFACDKLPDFLKKTSQECTWTTERKD